MFYLSLVCSPLDTIHLGLKKSSAFNVKRIILINKCLNTYFAMVYRLYNLLINFAFRVNLLLLDAYSDGFTSLNP